MYKAARNVHTNGIHNTFTSKGRGKMNHIKQFFREKGLYLFCLAMVFAATAAGILALRNWSVAKYPARHARRTSAYWYVAARKRRWSAMR